MIGIAPCSEQSDDDDDSDEGATLSPADRAARMEVLVAPLDPESWGHKETPLASVPPASKPLPPREPKLTEEKYDGASSDSSDEEVDASEVKETSEVTEEDVVMEDEDAPAILDEEEVNMQEEMDEFLKFATETLGLTAEQYSAILGERRGRGGESFVCEQFRMVSDFALVAFSFRTASTSTEENERRTEGQACAGTCSRIASSSTPSESQSHRLRRPHGTNGFGTVQDSLAVHFYSLGCTAARNDVDSETADGSKTETERTEAQSSREEHWRSRILL